MENLQQILIKDAIAILQSNHELENELEEAMANLPLSKMTNEQVLAHFLPLRAAAVVALWIEHCKCDFVISKARKSKLGDYWHPSISKNGKHRITVNHNLNPYSFLLVTIHEFAHLSNRVVNGRMVRSHGKEWQLFFRQLIIPFLEHKVFPKDIHQAMAKHIIKPMRSHMFDRNLRRVVRAYDY